MPLAPALINTADLWSWQLPAMFDSDWPCNLLVDVWLSCHISATNTTYSPSTCAALTFVCLVMSQCGSVRNDGCYIRRKGMGHLEWSSKNCKSSRDFCHSWMRHSTDREENSTEIRPDALQTPKSIPRCTHKARLKWWRIFWACLHYGTAGAHRSSIFIDTKLK